MRNRVNSTKKQPLHSNPITFWNYLKVAPLVFLMTKNVVILVPCEDICGDL